MKSFYDILEVPEDADERTLKRAFHRLALKWHPDICPQESEHFREIKEAYEALMDSKRRRAHDEMLAASRSVAYNRRAEPLACSFRPSFHFSTRASAIPAGPISFAAEPMTDPRLEVPGALLFGTFFAI